MRTQPKNVAVNESREKPESILEFNQEETLKCPDATDDSGTRRERLRPGAASQIATETKAQSSVSPAHGGRGREPNEDGEAERRSQTTCHRSTATSVITAGPALNNANPRKRPWPAGVIQ